MIKCWLEAGGISGHALATKQGSSFDFDKVCDTLNILKPDYATSLLKEEVGCNSTYMPYGFLDADTHISHMARFALSLLNGDNNNNKNAMSSFGDIEFYEKWIDRDIHSWTVVEHNNEALSL